MLSFFSGIMLGLSLIIAIGAQNIWVLSQSMAGANRFALASACIFSDVLLIILGVYAASEIKALLPAIIPWLTYGGVLMLIYLAGGAAYRAYQGSSGLSTAKANTYHWKVTVSQTLMISFLNPHVYLDTVVLLGSIGALQPSPQMFAFGACIGSIIWFIALTAFSPTLKRWLSSTVKWRIFDSFIAFILLFMAYQLLNFIY
ncbi:LysE family transporter [Thalassotalea sp. 1_MG-2023]|uniref:LysE/ArgO family amino acid transporter n=1 Tax=Thalassotalea sp. 1_MG-2023 TaxID=3062680 RepID=UPI0026E39291|nr:LysE family transporter [Thalassotalea sp. 1_MG-2023]MDO6427121.1 LysE family transporter [Thalassotalea sp. 1_MG-2023]